MYIDASAARSAKCVPLTIMSLESKYWMSRRHELPRATEPLQLVFPIDHERLTGLDLSIDGLFPPKSWRSFCDSRGSDGPQLRGAQFSGQGLTGLVLAHGTILLSRTAQLTAAKVLVSFCYGMDDTSKSVVRLQYWPDDTYPGFRQECRCYQKAL